MSLQRATEPGAEEAVPNMPFLPGDRVWSDAAGRAEFQFADGAILRLDRGSKLDYVAHEEGDERAGDPAALVRLADVHPVEGRGAAEFVVETPGGVLVPQRRGVYRVDVDAGETRVSVYEGEAVLEADRRLTLRAGERAFARGGEAYGEAETFDRAEADDFARWDAERYAETRVAQADVPEYLPEDITPYAGELRRPRLLVLRGGRRPRLAALRGCRLAAVPQRPLDLDVVRMDLAALRALGVGALPLRALGSCARARLVLGARARLVPGLGGLGGRQRLRRLVSAGLARPARARRDARRAAGRCRAGRDANAWLYARRGDLAARDLSRRVALDTAVPRQHDAARAARARHARRQGRGARRRATSRRARASRRGARSCAPTTEATLPFPDSARRRTRRARTGAGARRRGHAAARPADDAAAGLPPAAAAPRRCRRPQTPVIARPFPGRARPRPAGRAERGRPCARPETPSPEARS